jgi:hypothetical protein
MLVLSTCPDIQNNLRGEKVTSQHFYTRAINDETPKVKYINILFKFITQQHLMKVTSTFILLRKYHIMKACGGERMKLCTFLILDIATR